MAAFFPLPMSAIGTKRTSLVAPHMSAFGGKADMVGRHSHYDFPVLQFGKLSLAPWERAREIEFQAFGPGSWGQPSVQSHEAGDAIRRYFWVVQDTGAQRKLRPCMS